MSETARSVDVAVDLLRSDGAYHSLLDAITIPVAAVSKDMTLLFCNSSFAELFGGSAAGIEGRNLLQIRPEFTEAGCFDVYGHALERGTALDAEVRCGERVIHSRVFPAPWGIVAIAEDVTERREDEYQRRLMEEQVQQLQKLDSLGVLAGGIAHDFNNLLMGILGNADLALLDLPESSALRKNLLAIKEASQRASKVANQMLSYSGRERLSRSYVNLNQMVKEMEHLLQVAVPKSVVIKYDLSAQIPAVEVDAAKVGQILMNLVMNAAEAIGERSGIVAIRTGVTLCDDELKAGAFLKENLIHPTCVCLEVADTGCGMNKEVLSKIFDPFFSTKFTGRGLGLATLFGIVRSHHGAICVESHPGYGTTFKILLPPSEETLPDEQREAQSEGESQSGSGTILLVDDDETIRIVATEMLDKFGYTVLTASDGREAVNVFQKNAGKIDLVLLDLSMPHMDGKEACVEIHRIDASVPVIISSGYGEEAIESTPELNVAGFLKKPFTSALLFDKVLSALGESAT